jgi:hypothetical protein
MTVRRRWPHLAASLLAAAVVTACAGGALHQARVADDLRDYDLAVANYLKALREHPANKEAQLGL